MTLAVTSFRAYGDEIMDATNIRARQRVNITVTGANTDVSWDLASYTGTLWTAALADGTYGTVAAQAIAAMKLIDGFGSFLVHEGGTIPMTLVKGTSAGSGTYAAALSGLWLNYTFNTAAAPTSATIALEIALKPEQRAINVSYGA